MHTDLPHHIGQLRCFMRKLWCHYENAIADLPDLSNGDQEDNPLLSEYSNLIELSPEFTAQEYQTILEIASCSLDMEDFKSQMANDLDLDVADMDNLRDKLQTLLKLRDTDGE